MDTVVDTVQNLTLCSDLNKTKRKCLTASEYDALTNRIDSLINDKNDFVLNKYGWLARKILGEYSHLDKYTVFSIIDTRVQYYVRQRHHRAFNNSSSVNSPLHSSITSKTSTTISPNQSPSHHQQYNRRSTNLITTYEKYKELAANSVISPLTTLADNLRMPAMLVAKTVLTKQKQEEKQKSQLNTSNTLNDCSGIFNDSDLVNDGNKIESEKNNANDIITTELDTSSSIDSQLLNRLEWLSNKLISMHKVMPVEELDQSTNSSTNSSIYHDSTATKSVNLTPHQLATSTWLLRSDPQLAYEVFKCSIIDGYYGTCAEFMKSCSGKRFEQLLKQRMTSIMETKSLTNIPKYSLYTTENECRLRGLDMTPDMLLNEPIAISLSEDDGVKDNDAFTATNYTGHSDNGIRVINWIESKALFGGPEQLHTAMQRQLFPYWNRHGPGAVIYWFGHILEDNGKDQNEQNAVSTKKPSIECVTGQSINKSTDMILTELTSSKFWSKYCLLMDGFPASNKIILHNHWNNNRHNNTKKKLYNC